MPSQPPPARTSSGRDSPAPDPPAPDSPAPGPAGVGTATHARPERARSSLLAGYRPVPGVHDEMVTADGVVRTHWQDLATAVDRMGPDVLATRQHQITRALQDDGVNYHVHGDEPRSDQWGLDVLPMVVGSDEWQRLESGILQRAELLDAVLADLYGPRTLVAKGLLPPEVVFGHPGFLRPLDGVRLPGPSQLVTLAVDVARTPDGTMVVLADRAQAPSGAGYALENRQVMARVMPSLYRSMQVHRLAPFFRALRGALQAAAPDGVDEPRAVVLTPGPTNETAWEHGVLASTLGHALVEGSDLVARRGRLWLRSLDALEPVDVVLRRIDASWCDPLELRSASRLGVPGLVEVARRGNVSIVNPLGAGIIENHALHAFLPAIARDLLGQDLRLATPRTLWCGDADARREALARLDDLVCKPIARGPGMAAVDTRTLDTAGRAELVARIEAHPHRWVAQERVAVGVTPAVADGDVVARRSVLRTFCVAREGSWTMMPGGLTRVADDDGLVISNQRGAISKDTWVLTSEPESVTSYWLRSGPSSPVTPAGSMSARAAENLFWMGRYAERAEGLVRLLRVVEERRTDLSSPQGSSPAGRTTLGVLLDAVAAVTATPRPGGRGDPVHAGDDQSGFPAAALHDLVARLDRPGTLAHAIRRLVEAAQVVRDQLSGDTWMVLTGLERELAGLAATGHDDEVAGVARLGRMLTHLLALQGLGAESMVRDPGWQFMDAGRRIERALHVVALLRATVLDDHGTAADSLLYESVLTAAESIVTYRRRYRSRAQLATMLDLLVLDPDNPRAVAHQLDRLVADLAALPSHPGLGAVSEAQRPVLDAATLLRLADTDDLAAGSDGRRDDLAAMLGTLRALLRTCSDVVEGSHFRHQKPLRDIDVGIGPSSGDRDEEYG